jgi:branched-chain amino acid transport system ATP-binding protein
MSGALLELRQVTINFGGLRAVAGLDLALEPGGLYGLIGPNGAGKTTVFNAVTGVYAPSGGSILFEDRPIHGQPTCRIAARGIARTFQSPRLFPDLTCLDNVRIACHLHGRLGLADSALRTDRSVAEEQGILDRSEGLLEAFGLAKYRDQEARNLPYGEMRRLEIARTLATEPRLVLLDEPAAGMNPQETVALMRLIHDLRDRHRLTVLLIEHDMRVVMGICERITVLDHGVKIAEGPPDAIRRDRRVIEAYLGEGA